MSLVGIPIVSLQKRQFKTTPAQDHIGENEGRSNDPPISRSSRHRSGLDRTFNTSREGSLALLGCCFPRPLKRGLVGERFNRDCLKPLLLAFSSASRSKDDLRKFLSDCIRMKGDRDPCQPQLIPRRIIGSRHCLQFVRAKERCELLKRHPVTFALTCARRLRIKTQPAESISWAHDGMGTERATKSASCAEVGQSEGGGRICHRKLPDIGSRLGAKRGHVSHALAAVMTHSGIYGNPQ
jgi:hypothetical protein